MRRWVVAVAIALVLGGCAEAPIENDPSAPTDPDIACADLTPQIVALGNFPKPLHRIDEQSTVSNDGVTSCLFGDGTAKAENVNALGLVLTTSKYLDENKLTPDRAIRLGSGECVAGTDRTLSAGQLGSAAFFCIGKPGSVRGAWVHGDSVYNLNYFSTTDKDAPPATRLATFETIAKAIEANLPS